MIIVWLYEYGSNLEENGKNCNLHCLISCKVQKDCARDIVTQSSSDHLPFSSSRYSFLQLSKFIEFIFLVISLAQFCLKSHTKKRLACLPAFVAAAFSDFLTRFFPLFAWFVFNRCLLGFSFYIYISAALTDSHREARL